MCRGGWGGADPLYLNKLFETSVYIQDACMSLARPRRKQTRKHVTDARDFNNIETRAVNKSPPPYNARRRKKVNAILVETLASFLPGGANGLSAPL